VAIFIEASDRGLDERVMKAFLILILIIVLLSVSAILYQLLIKVGETTEGRLFPFYLPWNDSDETVTSFSRFIDKPAGKYGYVYVGSDGHLYVGDRRIRFLGVNICGGGAFPDKDDAEKIAARLAKYGVNIVRFHCLEAPWESFNILGEVKNGVRLLNPDALDKLDYFIAKLKENGIYVDLNLLVCRRFTGADGLPPEVEEVDWKDQQVLGFFMDEMLELEREYARQLLTHRNPYTGLTYAEEPAVAFVEIVNEQGLMHSWLDGVIDSLPDVFKQKLRERWNRYLLEKYGSTDTLLKAWAVNGSPEGAEMLDNGYFEQGEGGWSFEVHDDAEASFDIVEYPEGLKVLRVVVTRLGKEKWHVQFNYPGLRIETGQVYKVTFRARADREATVYVSLMQAHEPWRILSNRVAVKLTEDWRNYTITLLASKPEDDARLDITELGAATATYEFTCFSLKPYYGVALLEGESLEKGTVNILELRDFGLRTWEARRDWVEFLWKLEEAYFTGMYRFLKDELGVKALVIGTVVGCSTPNIMAEMDVVDAHAYWQHPVFPGTPWDPDNWYVVNEPMVNHPEESTVPWLAFKRVYGKPFTVSEYNHPAPNIYDAETAIFLATYAALQDWDGIFLFDYGVESEAIGDYFDVSPHPAKMATMLIAHNLFVRGDLRPAEGLVALNLTKDEEVGLILWGKVHAWNLPDAGYLGATYVDSLIHRIALVTDESPLKPIHVLRPQADTGTRVYRSDTGEVTWDVSEPGFGLLTVDTSRTVAAVGFIAGRELDFGDVVIELNDTVLDGFAAVSLTVIDGGNLSNCERMLLIAVGYTANTGMELREYETGERLVTVTEGLQHIKRFNKEITCNGTWGEPPVLTEGIDAVVKVKAGEEIEVWTLDNTGRRVEQIPVTEEDGYRVFTISHSYKTVWYEITLRG